MDAFLEGHEIPSRLTACKSLEVSKKCPCKLKVTYSDETLPKKKKQSQAISIHFVDSPLVRGHRVVGEGCSSKSVEYSHDHRRCPHWEVQHAPRPSSPAQDDPLYSPVV